MSRVTPKHAYYRPILEALVEFGGTEETDSVCRRVYEKVQATLTSADLETTKTPPYEAKWRNHTRWARNEMVAQGLLSGGKLHGWWKITDIGRKWLSAQKRKDRAQRPRKTRRLSVTVDPRLLTLARRKAAKKRVSLTRVIAELLDQWSRS